jgi:hypothetical protein
MAGILQNFARCTVGRIHDYRLQPAGRPEYHYSGFQVIHAINKLSYPSSSFTVNQLTGLMSMTIKRVLSMPEQHKIR